MWRGSREALFECGLKGVEPLPALRPAMEKVLREYLEQEVELR